MNISALTKPVPAPVAERLVAFATETTGPQIPASARHIMQLSVLDWIAVGFAGRDEPVSRIVRDRALADGGTAEAGILGSDQRLPVRAAAMVNATTGHALDYDDTHFAFFGHPTVSAVPTAFALAEKTGASMAQALDAALIGAEVTCRVGKWLGQAHYDAGFHQTATSGSFGAAMAAARVLGLDAERAGHALGIVSTRASGLKSQFGTMGKPYHAGMAAANGVEAALLAAEGFVSNPDGLDGTQGFAATHGAARDAAALDSLGEDWLFEAVQHKFHACCHGTHAMLEAIQLAKTDHAVTASDAQAVTISIDPLFLKVCNIAEPSTGLEAKFSFRLAAAMALSGWDTARLETFSAAACTDPALVALRDRVKVEARDVGTPTTAEVRIETAGGAVETQYDIDAELPVETRTRKVRAKAASLLGGERAEAMWSRIAEMPTKNSPFRLTDLLGGRAD